jgi:hypothetical protein
MGQTIPCMRLFQICTTAHTPNFMYEVQLNNHVLEGEISKNQADQMDRIKYLNKLELNLQFRMFRFYHSISIKEIIS